MSWIPWVTPSKLNINLVLGKFCKTKTVWFKSFPFPYEIWAEKNKSGYQNVPKIAYFGYILLFMIETGFMARTQQTNATTPALAYYVTIIYIYRKRLTHRLTILLWVCFFACMKWNATILVFFSNPDELTKIVLKSTTKFHGVKLNHLT